MRHRANTCQNLCSNKRTFFFVLFFFGLENKGFVFLFYFKSYGSVEKKGLRKIATRSFEIQKVNCVLLWDFKSSKRRKATAVAVATPMKKDDGESEWVSEKSVARLVIHYYYLLFGFHLVLDHIFLLLFRGRRVAFFFVPFQVNNTLKLDHFMRDMYSKIGTMASKREELRDCRSNSLLFNSLEIRSYLFVRFVSPKRRFNGR